MLFLVAESLASQGASDGDIRALERVEGEVRGVGDGGSNGEEVKKWGMKYDAWLTEM